MSLSVARARVPHIVRWVEIARLEYASRMIRRSAYRAMYEGIETSDAALISGA
jgi:hypothetical protein